MRALSKVIFSAVEKLGTVAIWGSILAGLAYLDGSLAFGYVIGSLFVYLVMDQETEDEQ